MDWTIEQVGLIDPRTRAPVRDGWDGLARLLSGNHPARTCKPHPAAEARPTGGITGNGTLPGRKTLVRKLSQDDWFSEMDRLNPCLSFRLLSFLKECEELGAGWSLNEVLLVRVNAKGTMLSVLGIERDGRIELPWYIAGYKPEFRRFAETIADAIPGAKAYETPKMWGRAPERGVGAAEAG